MGTFKIAVSKTREMVFGSTAYPQHTMINNGTVESVDSFKYLRLTVDNTIKSDNHTTDIQERTLGSLTRVALCYAFQCIPISLNIKVEVWSLSMIVIAFYILSDGLTETRKRQKKKDLPRFSSVWAGIKLG